MSGVITPAQTMGIDPITFQVLNNAFSSVVDEMAALVQNCAFSPVVSDGRDYSGTICNPAGDLVASGTTDLPAHLGTIPFTVKGMLEWIGGPKESYFADGDIVVTLTQQMKETLRLLRALPDSAATLRYAPDKWTLNQMIGHVIDTERIFASRALRFSRNDPQPLPSFEQDHYAANSNFDAYPLAELVAELDVVRQGTIFQFRHLEDAAWLRRGVAGGAEVTVRALAYITAGHELHHRQILKTRYLR